MNINLRKLAYINSIIILSMGIFVSLLTNSCSNDKESSEPEGIEPLCNFKDLVVETSWESGQQDLRKTYHAVDVDDEDWMDVYADGRVMMKCLAQDGHRTELKEDSGDEAALNSSKEMQFDAIIYNIPENGVTIAQIHNRGGVKRPFIRLYIDDDNYLKIKETETDPTASNSLYSTYVGPKYTSGDSITVKIYTGIDGEHKGDITIITNGTTWNQTVMPSSDWSNFSNDYYLKAGVYTEGNDLQATVEYSYFYISH